MLLTATPCYVEAGGVALGKVRAAPGGPELVQGTLSPVVSCELGLSLGGGFRLDKESAAWAAPQQGSRLPRGPSPTTKRGAGAPPVTLGMQPRQAVSMGGAEPVVRIPEVTATPHWRGQLGTLPRGREWVQGLERGSCELRPGRRETGWGAAGERTPPTLHSRSIQAPPQTQTRRRARPGVPGPQGCGAGGRRWLRDRGRGTVFGARVRAARAPPHPVRPRGDAPWFPGGQEVGV